MTTTVRARLDPSLTARVVRAVPLLYAQGADAALDRPAHVRSASGLVRVGARVAIIQDDANFVALADPATGVAQAIVLPAGEGGLRQFDDVRGNKRHKLDLESCILVDDAARGEMLVAFGSGSTAARERIVVVRGVACEEPEVRVVDASRLYAALRAEPAFAGSELNVEGAVAIGGVLRLFNRGNGAPVDGSRPVDASGDLDLAAFLAFLADATIPPPEVRNVAQYDLGDVDGLPLTFTDAAARGESILYTAAAEASPDATRDGPVAGCAIGIIRNGEARFAIVQAEDGDRTTAKIEGILPHPDDPSRLWCVVDRDDPAAPCDLLEIVLGGDWS